MSLPKLNVIFPMAGDGIRFGGVFKPFQYAGESYFIELAKERFNIFAPFFTLHYYLIYRQDQEEKYSVKSKLLELFPHDTLHFCIIPTKTIGPLHTVLTSLKTNYLDGFSFVCDCDLSIGLQPFLNYLLSEDVPDYIVSLYTISKANWFEWGKAVLDESNTLIQFCEKENPSLNGTVMGLIGCHFIKDINSLLPYENISNFSHAFQEEFLTSRKCSFVSITDTHFFGTPQQLTAYKLQIAQKKSFFIDIDGTIIHTTDPLTYDSLSVRLLPQTIETLTEYKKQGHQIILTTSRKNKVKLIKLLEDLHIPYDELITNLPSGQRIIINDKKPYAPLLCMAVAYQPDRDHGISNIRGISYPAVIRKMYGCSAADVYLLEVQGKKVIRKYIKKTLDKSIHCENLKRQLDEIKRFNFYWKNSCPTILETFENNDEFYYDMEYLEHYVPLSTLHISEQIRVLDNILNNLFTNIYCYKKSINGIEWLNAYIQEKITPKLNEIEQYDEIFYNIVNAPFIKINNTVTKGLRTILEEIDISRYAPSDIQPIHGDLTLENILYCVEENDIKLIDHSGAKYMDSHYLDLGKVFQSVIAKYEGWKDIQLFRLIDKDTYELNPFNLNISAEDFEPLLKFFKDQTDPFKKGLFYMITHLIRAVPYIYKKDMQRALYAAVLSCWYFSVLEQG